MTTLREAAQQALEALKTGGWNMTTRAIADLERALAQQDEPQGCATEEDCTKQPWCRIRGECQRKQAEPVEPVAWECKAGGLKPLTQRQYDAQTAATKRHYTRIASPQRDALLEACRAMLTFIERHAPRGLQPEPGSPVAMARAAIKAVEETK